MGFCADTTNPPLLMATFSLYLFSCIELTEIESGEGGRQGKSQGDNCGPTSLLVKHTP